MDFSTKASNAETMVACAEASADDVIPTIVIRPVISCREDGAHRRERWSWFLVVELMNELNCTEQSRGVVELG